MKHSLSRQLPKLQPKPKVQMHNQSIGQSNNYKQTKINQNSIIIEKVDKKKKIYLPGYLRLKLKNFVSMDLKNLDIQLNVAIIFSVKYGNLIDNQSSLNQSYNKNIELSQQIRKQLKNKLIFLFEKDEGMKVVEQQQQQKKLQVTVKQDKKLKQIKYTIRRKINAKVYPDVFYTPFQLIHSIVSITVQPIKLNNKNEDLIIYFNLMDHPNNFLKLSYDTADAFGNYSLAWNCMRSFFSNQRVDKYQTFYNLPSLYQTDKISNQQNNQSKITQKQQKYIDDIEKLKKKLFRTQIQQEFIERYQKNKQTKYQFQPFKFGHFLIPIYKYPSVQILTIFLPLALLSIINLGIFFQNWDLYDRIASIAVLLIAFVALIPTLRQQLPPTTKLVLIEYLVYLQTYTCIIALAHSLNIMSEQKLLTQQLSDPLLDIDPFKLDISRAQFLISLIITIVVNAVIIILLLIHKIIWQPGYNVKPLIIQEKEQFIASSWSNPECKRKLEKAKIQLGSISQINSIYQNLPRKNSK